jgi:hypothetical protein
MPLTVRDPPGSIRRWARSLPPGNSATGTLRRHERARSPPPFGEEIVHVLIRHGEIPEKRWITFGQGCVLFPGLLSGAGAERARPALLLRLLPRCRVRPFLPLFLPWRLVLALTFAPALALPPLALALLRALAPSLALLFFFLVLSFSGGVASSAATSDISIGSYLYLSA